MRKKYAIFPSDNLESIRENWPFKSNEKGVDWKETNKNLRYIAKK